MVAAAPVRPQARLTNASSKLKNNRCFMMGRRKKKRVIT